MHRPVQFLSALLLAASVAACQDRSAPSGSVASDANVAAHASSSAAAAPTRSVGSAAPPSTPPPTITLSLVNRSEQARYTDFGRSPFDHVKLERFEAGKWISLSYRVPYCSTPCPPDPTQADCNPCSPPMPWPSRLEPKSSVAHSWRGEAYSTEPYGSGCHCYRQRAVPHGRYRVSLCVRPQARCGTGPCTKRSAEPPQLVGKEICAEREFAYDGTNRTVALTIEE